VLWIGIVLTFDVDLDPHFHYDAYPDPVFCLPHRHQNDADPQADRIPKFYT
jgi:hypothetical protein